MIRIILAAQLGIVAVLGKKKLSESSHTADHQQLRLQRVSEHLYRDDDSKLYDQALINEMVKPAVVTIQRSCELPFYADSAGVSTATGFWVDLEAGLILTNKHVSGVSPSHLFVQTYSGSVLPADVEYYDATLDFALLKVIADAGSKALKFSSKRMAVGDDLLLVGSNEGADYTMKWGKVANLMRLLSPDIERGSFVQTSFDRTGGASGSPVLNSDLEVVAIHDSGTDTTSYEIATFGLIQRVIEAVAAKKPVHRGDIGLLFSQVTVGQAINHYGLPKSIGETMMERRESEFGGPPNCLIVQATVPGLPSSGIFTPGDILVAIEGVSVGEDLNVFTGLLDEHVDDDVSIEIVRAGHSKEFKVRVVDQNEWKITSFATIGGALFHDVTPEMRADFAGTDQGVYLSHVATGSTFSLIGASVKDAAQRRKLIVESIEDKTIRSLSDFILAMRSAKDGDNIYLVVHDYFDATLQGSSSPKAVSLHIADSELTAWTLDHKTKKWNFKKY